MESQARLCEWVPALLTAIEQNDRDAVMREAHQVIANLSLSKTGASPSYVVSMKLVSKTQKSVERYLRLAGETENHISVIVLGTSCMLV